MTLVLILSKDVFMQRIQKVSGYLLVLFNVLLISLPVLIVLQWVGFPELLERTVQTPEGYVALNTVPWTPLSKFLGVAAEILGLIPFLLSLLVLKAIFRNYQKGEIFTVSNAMKYKKLGWLFLWDALVITSLSQTLMVFAITMTNPPGHRYINIQFGVPNMKALFCGVLLLVISWVMLEASKLREEQRFTI